VALALLAVDQFVVVAAGGFRGTSTAVIAREAGISQPCLFRLFRTKKELFLAAGERTCQQLLETFRRAAAAAPPGERLQAMGHAYGLNSRWGSRTNEAVGDPACCRRRRQREVRFRCMSAALL
jgi:AcrR family transcriptional regulator